MNNAGGMTASPWVCAGGRLYLQLSGSLHPSTNIPGGSGRPLGGSRAVGQRNRGVSLRARTSFADHLHNKVRLAGQIK